MPQTASSRSEYPRHSATDLDAVPVWAHFDVDLAAAAPHDSGVTGMRHTLLQEPDVSVSRFEDIDFPDPIDALPHIIDNDVQAWFARKRRQSVVSRLFRWLAATAVLVLAAGTLTVLGALVIPAIVRTSADHGLTSWLGESATAERPFPATEITRAFPTSIAGYDIELTAPSEDLAAALDPGAVAWTVTTATGVASEVVAGTVGGDESGNAGVVATSLDERLHSFDNLYIPFVDVTVDDAGAYRTIRKQASAAVARGIFDFRYLYVPYKGTAVIVSCSVEDVCRDLVGEAIEWTRQARVQAGDVEVTTGSTTEGES